MQDSIDQNFNRHACFIPALTDGMKVHHGKHLSWVDSDLSCDTFNIIHITDGQSGVEKELQAAIQYFRQKQFAHCVWVSESNLSDFVSHAFTELGLQSQGEETGMKLDLGNLDMDFSPSASIQVVRSREALSQYAKVIAENWSPPDQNVLAYYHKTAGHYLNPDHQINLLVYLEDGEAVCCAEMFPTDAETVGLYGFATLEAWRGKGIGSALFQASLQKAKEHGYQQVVLQATEDGIGIYTRYGFVVGEKYFEFS
ncbi:MAG: GNAT family N-acetyltransferase [Bacteroidota bacterium]